MASIVITGTIVIRESWSAVMPTSRATRTPKSKRTPTTGDTTMFGIDISRGNPDELDCPNFRYQEDAQEVFDVQGWSAWWPVREQSSSPFMTLANQVGPA